MFHMTFYFCIHPRLVLTFSLTLLPKGTPMFCSVCLQVCLFYKLPSGLGSLQCLLGFIHLFICLFFKNVLVFLNKHLALGLWTWSNLTPVLGKDKQTDRNRTVDSAGTEVQRGSWAWGSLSQPGAEQWLIAVLAWGRGGGWEMRRTFQERIASSRTRRKKSTRAFVGV